MIGDDGGGLAHDHDALTGRVATMRVELKALQRAGTGPGDLAPALAELRELLWSHFAREEGSLFPFLAEIRSDLAAEVDALVAAHDTICAAVARMCDLAVGDNSLAPMVAMFERFEAVYAAHTHAETELLVRLSQFLDSDARARLSVVIESL